MRDQLLLQIVCVVITPLALIAQVPASEIRCNYKTRTACIKGECKPISTEGLVTGSFVLLPSVPDLLRASRKPNGGVVDVRLCDPDGCSPVPMRASIDGDWLYLLQANGGTQYVKVYVPANGPAEHGYIPGEFVELESFMLDTVIGNGQCQWPHS